MLFRRCLPVAVTGLLLATPSALAADCPGADALPGTTDPGAVRVAVLCLTNAERAAAALPPLSDEPTLEAAAQAYSQRLVSERFFAHDGPDGSTLGMRLAGYRDWLAIGENLAWGEGGLGTPRAIVAAWMASPGHRANLLSSSFAEVGLGVTPGTPEGRMTPAATFVASYGARSVEVAAPPPPPRVARVATRMPATRVMTFRTVQTARKPPACRRGTLRRVMRVKGRRAVRCVRAAPGRR